MRGINHLQPMAMTPERRKEHKQGAEWYKRNVGGQHQWLAESVEECLKDIERLHEELNIEKRAHSLCAERARDLEDLAKLLSKLADDYRGEKENE